MEKNPSTNNQLSAIAPTSEADLLASVGVDVEMIYDGDPDGCPHCAAPFAAPGRLDKAA